MDELAQTEQSKYTFLWEHLRAYREESPGERFVSHFFDHFKERLMPRDTLIDFGTGTGRAAKYFLQKNLQIKLVDFCANCLDEEMAALCVLLQEELQFLQACLWQLPDVLVPADWIYCCDVLEHLPEVKIDLALAGMASRTKKGGYLSICLKEDPYGKQLVGEPLHLSVKDKIWWREKVSKYWKIEQEIIVFEDLYFNCCIVPHGE